MQITLETKPYATVEADALVAFVFEENDPIQSHLLDIDSASNGLLKKLHKSGELTGKMLEFTLIHAPAGLAAPRLLLVGAGKREQFSGATLRKVAGAAARSLKSKGVKKIAFLVGENEANDAAAQAITEAVTLANFETDKWKTDKKGDKNIDAVLLAGYPESGRTGAEAGISKGRVISDAQNFTRDLVNEPSNKLTPKILAEKAEAMARESGLAVEILDERRIADLKMGALLSVAQAGPEPPRVIVVTYVPAKANPNAPVIGLVGKAVTFDTGGVSIKPADGMEKMKYDMAGGATMLGVMRAIAALKPSVKVICVVPSTENVISGSAQKPGDIQTAMSGKTIEVLNTDAEGRLILADAVTFAKQLGATVLVDAATLTGAIVVALANINVGVFGSDQAFTDKLLVSAKAAGEKMWQMPMDDEYREFIKGSFADLQNIGSGKGGGSITGAWFIREFAGDTPWIHLDIAGTAWNDEAKPWLAKGPTAVALRTLVHLVMSY
jgi:leucyl aminopeptidase